MTLASGARLGLFEVLSAGSMRDVFKACRYRILAMCVISIVTVGSPRAIAQVSAPETRAWVIEYGDGRVVSAVLQPKGSMWTPKFPRIVGADTSRAGLPLYALEVAYVVQDQDVRFAISLLYDGLQMRVPVEEVRVTSKRQVRIDELRAYGVEPITLSLMAVPPTLAYSPAVENASALLEVRVDPVAPHVPVYRVVLTNHSTQALLAIRYGLYRGGEVVLTGLRRDDRNEPLVRPGQEYVFDLPISRGNSETWGTIDRAVISSIMWDDGRVEGDPAPAKQERIFREGRAVSIRQVLALLRLANQRSLSDFRNQFASMSLFDPIMRRIRDAALARLDDMIGRNDLADIRVWVAEQIGEYEAWLVRVAGTSR